MAQPTAYDSSVNRTINTETTDCLWYRPFVPLAILCGLGVGAQPIRLAAPAPRSVAGSAP